MIVNVFEKKVQQLTQVSSKTNVSKNDCYPCVHRLGVQLDREESIDLSNVVTYQ